MGKQRISKGIVLTGGAQTGGLVERSKRFAISTATNGVEIDTGFDFPAGSVVKDVFIDVATLEQTATTKTISVGLLSSETNGATNGFLSSVSTASAGIYSGIQGLSATSGAFGSLLMETSTVSASVRRDHIVQSGKAASLTYTLNDAHTELVADLVVRFLEVA